MTTKHTPGPWYVENDRRMIADEEDGPVCYFYPRDNGSDLHNARLIAAAPDLLAALEAAHGYLVMMGTDHADHIRSVCRSAIAKAKGETP